MKPTPVLRAVLLASVFLAVASTTHAQTWDGSTNGSWNTGANWSTNSVPGSGAAITFDGTGINLNTTTNNAFTLGSLTFTAGQTAAVTINTDNTRALTMSSGGTKITVEAGEHQFIGTNGGSNAAADMIFSGASGNTFTLAIASGASFEIQGRIANAGSAPVANRNYNKTGGGTLILSGHNGGGGAWNHADGTNGFRILGGVLRMTHSFASGQSANKYTVSSGAALELVGANFGSANGTQTISGTGISGTGAIRSVSGTNPFGTTLSTGGITLAAASSIGVDAGQLNIGLAIGDGVNDFSLTKVGAGTLALSNTNTYSGATLVNSGTLQIDTGGSTAAASAATVSGSGALIVNGTVNGTLTANASTTISGSGTVAGAATVSGNLNPGSHLGVLSFSSSLALASTSTTTLQIAATGMVRGMDYDGINIGSTLGLNGDLLLDFGTTFAAGNHTFNLFDLFTGISGDFATVKLARLYTGTLTNSSGIWSTTTNSGNETWSFAQSTGDLSLTVIPEPRAALLGAVGLLALLRRRRA